MKRREVVKYSERLFFSGKNCAQSVSIAVFTYLNEDISSVNKIAYSFGGGIVDDMEICGALSGAFMCIGYFASDYDKMSRLKHKLYNDFKTEFEDTKCDFLKNNEKLPDSQNCSQLVAFCTNWCVNNIPD